MFPLLQIVSAQMWLKLGVERRRFQEVRCAVPLGSFEKLDQGEEPELAGGNAGYRWDVLSVVTDG